MSTNINKKAERPETPLSSIPSRDRQKLESLIERYQSYGEVAASATANQKTLKEEQIEPLRQRLGYEIIAGDTFKIMRQPGKESLDQSLLVRNMLALGLARKNEQGRYVAMTAQEIVALVNEAKKRGQPYTEIKRVGKRDTEDSE